MVNRSTILKDTIRKIFEFECDNRTFRLLWEALASTNAAGTFSITALNTCDGIRVYVNGDLVTTLEEGQTVIYTISPLETIEVECRRGPNSDNCKVALSLIVNYKLD